MGHLHTLLTALALSQAVNWAASQGDSPQAALSVWSGSTQLLVGETVTLSCSVPGNSSHGWKFWWYQDGLPLRPFALFDTHYSVVRAFLHHSGHYTCLGERDTDERSTQRTQPSLPLKLEVFGGWAVVQLLPQPLFSGDDATLTCHVWANPTLLEVTFYKDGHKLQSRRNPKLLLPRVSKKDQGHYWCKATWWDGSQWHTAQSVATKVSVVDSLTTPQLAVLSGTPMLQGQTLVLECQTHLNTPKRGLQMRYQYFRDGRSLGIATSRRRYTVHYIRPQDAGQYQCKVTVSGLAVRKWSDRVHVQVLDVSEAAQQNPGRRAHSKGL